MASSDKENIIRQFVTDHCSPSANEREFVSGKEGLGGEYARLRGYLAPNEVFQSGSYARHTAISPLNDLDIFYILDDQLKDIDDIHSYLEIIAKNLKQSYENDDINVEIESQTHSIQISFPDRDEEFTIDIVPALELDQSNEFDDSLFEIPEIGLVRKPKRKSLYDERQKKGEKIEWIKTDPKGYKTAIRDDDKKASNRLRRAVRLIKCWRREWKIKCPESASTEFKIKSFHLELIAQKVFENASHNIGVLDAIEQSLVELRDSYIEDKHFLDRASTTNHPKYVDEYITALSNDERELVRRACKNGIILIQRAKIASEPDKFEDYLYRFSKSSEEFIVSFGYVRNAQTIQDDISNFYITAKVIDGTNSTSGLIEVQKGQKIYFSCHLNKDGLRKLSGTCDNFYWKVRNVGKEARQQKQLRGEITLDQTLVQKECGHENADYLGKHVVECYGVNSVSGKVLRRAICEVIVVE